MPPPAKFAILALSACLAFSADAKAALVINIDQVGRNVVATSAGSLNTASLTVNGSAAISPSIFAALGSIVVGQGTSNATIYNAFFSGPSPASYGPGAANSATSATGGLTGFNAMTSRIVVSTGYVSGSAISSTATFANVDYLRLGINLGTYAFTYAATQGGPAVDTITVRINPAVPEPASLALVGLGLAGLGIVARRRRS